MHFHPRGLAPVLLAPAVAVRRKSLDAVRRVAFAGAVLFLASGGPSCAVGRVPLNDSEVDVADAFIQELPAAQADAAADVQAGPEAVPRDAAPVDKPPLSCGTMPACAVPGVTPGIGCPGFQACGRDCFSCSGTVPETGCVYTSIFTCVSNCDLCS